MQCGSTRDTRTDPTFLDFKFMRMSSFMFCVTGSYRDIQWAFSGVILCCGTDTCNAVEIVAEPTFAAACLLGGHHHSVGCRHALLTAECLEAESHPAELELLAALLKSV